MRFETPPSSRRGFRKPLLSPLDSGALLELADVSIAGTVLRDVLNTFVARAPAYFKVQAGRGGARHRVGQAQVEVEPLDDR